MRKGGGEIATKIRKLIEIRDGEMAKNGKEGVCTLPFGGNPGQLYAKYCMYAYHAIILCIIIVLS